jgi:predicted outer membrane repeat protein
VFPKSSIKRTALLLLTFSLVLALAPVPAAHAATITVTTNADSGAGSLRQAIADAAVGDTITFGGDMTITLSSQLTISKSLTIDGQIHQVIVSGNHAVRVFSVMAAAGTVTFNHLTIADGNVATYDCGPAAMRCGGGIMIQDMSLTVNVINSILSGNVSPLGEGGGITNWGTLNVINSTFIGNSALARGGAIDNIFGTVNVINSTFSGNSALSYGGGIDTGGIVNVINSTFSGNSAPAAGGGGIYSPHNTATVRNSIMANNNGGNCYGTFDGANNLANDVGKLWRRHANLPLAARLDGH